MSTETCPEFTDDELATLRRFEQAPHAPEAKCRDMNPLVPTGDIRPADQVVPHPADLDVTAAQLSNYYAAQSYAAHGLGRHLMRRIKDFTAAPVADVQEMGDAYADMAHHFAIAYLLRHVPDEVARDLTAILEMGDSDEWVWQWLKEAGVNPQHIASAPDRAECVAAGEASRAERGSSS